jgi:aerobic carbon-monoxide dehydrogenase medium subunit
MFAAPFDYHRPTTVDEAIKLLRDVKGARVLAGGHSLLPAMKLRLASPAALIDVGRIAELSGISSTTDGLTIGAMTTHAAVAASSAVRQSCPLLADVAGRLGDQQVRNRGTIGGSLAHADPGADYPTLMLLLGATMTAADGTRRDIAAADFFVDLFTTALKPGELLLSVNVPALANGVYLKHRHPASSFAVVGVGAFVSVKNGKCDDVRIAVGGVTVTPVRASAAESALRGQTPSEENIANAAAKVADALKDPLGDNYASGEFRVHLATVMARRALTEAST